jgi:AcrR family transcriptional regulator
MLREVGVRGFSIVALAKRVAISKPGVYYYFDGGEKELLTEAYREMLRSEIEQLRYSARSVLHETTSDVVLIRDIEALIGRVGPAESSEFWKAFSGLSVYSQRDYMLRLMPAGERP